MKHLMGVAALAASFTVAAADGELKTVVSEKAKLPTCATPVARVTVGELQCKSAACAPAQGAENPLLEIMRRANGEMGRRFDDVGRGMQASLTSALKQTGCFDMQDLAAAEALRKQGIDIKIEPVDYLVAGDITAIACVGKSTGIGPMRKTTEQCSLTVDARIIDAKNARILDSATFVGDSASARTAWDFGIVRTGTSSSPQMEVVTRDVLGRVATFTTDKLVQRKGGAATPATASP